MELSGQLHAPAVLSPGKQPPVPIGQENGWAPVPVWTLWGKTLPLPGIEPWSSRDSSVGIALGYDLESCSSLPGRGKIFYFHSFQTGFGSHQSLIQWVRGAISPGVKRPRREVDYSPPSNAEVKNGGAIPPLPRMSSWHSVLLIKHRDKLFSDVFWKKSSKVRSFDMFMHAPSIRV
jgi:hypothetical protein